MSGHSKWSTIKRKKGAADAKRGKIFTRLMREITVAAKMGGGDIEMNPRLRTAVAAAKAANMPKDNIDKAVKKGSGDLDGVNYDEITYEGYGPGGVAFLVEVLTDNKNRTAADVRHVFTKRGGALAKAGAVSYLFEQKGLFTFDKAAFDEEKMLEMALEAGAEDVKDEDDIWAVYCEPTDFNAVSEALEQAGAEPQSAEVTKLPSTTVALTEAGEAGRVVKLMEALDDLDDVQNVYANFDIDDELLATLE
ncbi:MAG: YebC/PmpR family DNA-binding transcriptional regulator [Deltaproteobacteria bacterium]|nr:YebC/PmpR family DNA-binding transcriptional regulator [Deltaproteobacteria bacterium]